MNERSVFLSLSGGVDSATLYAFLLEQGMEVAPVFFTYPSRHNLMEHAAASRIAAHYGNALKQMDVTGLFSGLRSSLLIGGEAVPAGSYDEENLRKTVVPGRNTIFIAILSALAESAGGARVALGTHGGDYAVYPDCRPEYIASVKQTVLLSSLGRVEIIAPFASISKAEIVRFGMSRAVPYALTRSCYNGTDAPCRVCPTCRAREDAFKVNGLTDPLLERGNFTC
jgi:7-cyano-7-deazaguanine synthase